MSATMEPLPDDHLPATSPISDNQLSDLDPDGDGSSSLSEIEDKEADDHDLDQSHSEISDGPDDDDSEAETERLENSPEKLRKHKAVVVGSYPESRTFERSPSKLQHQMRHSDPADDDEDLDEREHDDDNELSDDDDDDGSIVETPKSASNGEVEYGPATAATSLGTSAGDVKDAATELDLLAVDRKRKRSIMMDSHSMNQPEDDDEEEDEPARKRMGSIMDPVEELAEEAILDEEGRDDSNTVIGELSDAGADGHEGDGEQPLVEEEGLDPVSLIGPTNPKNTGRRSSNKSREPVNDADADEQEQNGPIVEEPSLGDEDGENTAEAEDNAEAEGEDDMEAALKTEEELKRKRIALDQLTAIEQHFSAFKERLHEERLANIEQQEMMLKQDPPTHPEFLAMLRCIEERRDERIRASSCRLEYERECADRAAVARRSLILGQYYQTVRDIREKSIEQLGKEWYSVQHDRRGYAGSVPDFALKFPARKQQISHQVAYNKEVSILSGVAKYVGFPAAPAMASASAAEYEEDMEKMSTRAHQQQQVQRSHPGLPLHDLAAIRAASSTSRFRPAEEQFIEQTPWANPQHPAHVHLLQRQPSAQSRKTSPFSSAQARKPHQNGPISGTFASSAAHTSISNGAGRVSPLNPFSNAPHVHNKMVPSPLVSSQNSPAVQQSRPLPAGLELIETGRNPANTAATVVAERVPRNANFSTAEPHYLYDHRDADLPINREQAPAILGRI